MKRVDPRKVLAFAKESIAARRRFRMHDEVVWVSHKEMNALLGTGETKILSATNGLRFIYEGVTFVHACGFEEPYPCPLPPGRRPA